MRTRSRKKFRTRRRKRQTRKEETEGKEKGEEGEDGEKIGVEKVRDRGGQKEGRERGAAGAAGTLAQQRPPATRRTGRRSTCFWLTHG